MTHHVFAVWDFMSLVKYLQRHITPLEIPWMPGGDPRLRCFINQLALAGESSPTPGTDGNPICARIRFWDGILEAIDARRDAGSSERS